MRPKFLEINGVQKHTTFALINDKGTNQVFYIKSTRGPFIYYVITFLGFFDPPPPLRQHVFSTKNKQKLAFSGAEIQAHPNKKWLYVSNRQRFVPSSGNIEKAI